jgi:Peptidase family M23
MSNETRDRSQKAPACAQSDSHFIWPLSRSFVADEMNTSFGPRIDADRWDFHDGIDLPASVGSPVHAIASGVVHRAGPADKGFGSTHIITQVVDPTDGENDLFLVYLHLDSIAEGIIVGKEVNQGALIGAVGQEDATYPHLHMEFRKGGPQQSRSVHPLHYLPYINKANFKKPRLDRTNFYSDNGGEKRAIRLFFEALDRREGDLQAVEVELRGDSGPTRSLHVNFDDRATINSAKGDEQAFKNGIAVEGYQKSNLKGDGLLDLHYGVLVEDLTPEDKFVKLSVLDVKNGKLEGDEFSLPELKAGEESVDSRVDFEGQIFPPKGWELNLLSGNVCSANKTNPLSGSQDMLCQDNKSSQGRLIRAGLNFALPPRRMSWRLEADIKPMELGMERDQVIHPLAFLAGANLVAAACLRKIGDGEFAAGVLIRNANGQFRERIDVTEGKILPDETITWKLNLIRVGTRQTTAVLRFGNNVVARIDGDTTRVEPDSGFVGILHRHSGLQITMHVDQLVLTEALKEAPKEAPKPEQQTSGQIEPRGSRGVTGKGDKRSRPAVPRSPRG